jgi:hypothetical protein
VCKLTGCAEAAKLEHGTICPVRKRHFLRHLYIKINILPRQARDEHRESTQKKCRFPSEWRGWRQGASNVRGWIRRQRQSGVHLRTHQTVAADRGRRCVPGDPELLSHRPG